ncbi:hypothetical protein RB213_007567, partial [Colletotrichum asianum]
MPRNLYARGFSRWTFGAPFHDLACRLPSPIIPVAGIEHSPPPGTHSYEHKPSLPGPGEKRTLFCHQSVLHKNEK